MLSESLLIAIIGLISAVLVAFISAFATIWSNQKAQKPLECGVIGLSASGGAFGGLLLGLLLASTIVRITTNNTTNINQPTGNVNIQTATTEPVNVLSTQAPLPTIISSTPIPTIEATPVTIVLPDLSVSANASNGVQFAVPIDGQYRFTIRDGSYCTGGNVCRSIIRAYINKAVVWADWYGKPHPMEQNYELGCWEQETTNNSNCATGRYIDISLSAQDTITWIIMEDQNSFSDNEGTIILKVEKL